MQQNIHIFKIFSEMHLFLELNIADVEFQVELNIC